MERPSGDFGKEDSNAQILGCDDPSIYMVAGWGLPDFLGEAIGNQNYPRASLRSRAAGCSHARRRSSEGGVEYTKN